jgi:hypothetical protein
MEKLGAHTMAQAIALAMRHGVIPMPGIRPDPGPRAQGSFA